MSWDPDSGPARCPTCDRRQGSWTGPRIDCKEKMDLKVNYPDLEGRVLLHTAIKFRRHVRRRLARQTGPQTFTNGQHPGAWPSNPWQADVETYFTQFYGMSEAEQVEEACDGRR